MKKVLSIILTVTLCLGAFSVATSALEVDVGISVVAPTEKVSKGDTITVKVNLDSNAGISALLYNIKYDSEKLQLVGAPEIAAAFYGEDGTSGAYAGLSEDNLRFGYLKIPTSTAKEDNTATGTVVTYKFKVLVNGTSATEDVTTDIELQVLECINYKLEELTTGVNKGTVTIKYTEAPAFIYGDVNGDGRVNAIDRTVLARYLAKWTDYPESIIDMDAADVNNDGRVNAVDRTILARHLAKWTVYETLPYVQ